jgi:hypothetical protein
MSAIGGGKRWGLTRTDWLLRKNLHMPYTFQVKAQSIDISECSFDEFVDFLFDREDSPATAKRNPWYCNIEVAYTPDLICGDYVRLFRQPHFLLEKFSKQQLEEGFWAIPVGISIVRSLGS